MSHPEELEIAFEDRSGYDIDADRISTSAIKILSSLGYELGELGITMVSAEEMAGLNRMYMDREGPTDVLSFPLDADEVSVEAEAIDEIAGAAEGIPLLLGDVVICPEVAAAQAEAQGWTLAQELCLLVAHGILHIAGYDHESDAGEMDEYQARLVEEICTGGAGE